MDAFTLMFRVSYLILGVDEIGIQIEEPFATLPLSPLCKIIERICKTCWSIPTVNSSCSTVLPNNRITNSLNLQKIFSSHTFICKTGSFLTSHYRIPDYKQKRDDIVDDMLQSANIHIPKGVLLLLLLFYISTKNKKIRILHRGFPRVVPRITTTKTHSRRCSIYGALWRINQNLR